MKDAEGLCDESHAIEEMENETGDRPNAILSQTSRIKWKAAPEKDTTKIETFEGNPLRS
jgi:hypothetical protein